MSPFTRPRSCIAGGSSRASYALAVDRDEPLAFVGDDFQHTDLEVVRLPVV